MVKSLIIAGHYRRPTGYGCHVRETARGLDKLGIRVQLVDLPTGSRGALPEEKLDPWFDTLDRSVGAGAVLHICLPHQARIMAGLLNINFTTFEATRIPETWARLSMNQDLVVLPTQSSRRAWTAGGIAEERLRLGPSARIFWAIGVLGGFTTFSTFGYETAALIRQGSAAARAATGAAALEVVQAFPGRAVSTSPFQVGVPAQDAFPFKTWSRVMGRA